MSVAVLLFAGTALLLLVVLIVAVLLIVTRRVRRQVRGAARKRAEPMVDAWAESGRRTEPFDREEERD